MTDVAKLLAAARLAREQAYAPYSCFKVGAAVRSKTGRIFSGCNIENASYGLTMCAERAAVFQAVAAGERELDALAVVSDTSQPVAPCGACRQVMAEFGITVVVMANMRGQRRQCMLSTLLPQAFNAASWQCRDNGGNNERHGK